MTKHKLSVFSLHVRILLFFAMAAPSVSAADELFFIADGGFVRHPESKGPPTAAEIAAVEKFGTLPPLDAIRRLGLLIRNAASDELRNLAFDRLMQVEGWQDELEALLLEAKAGWDNREDKRSAPGVSIRGMDATGSHVWMLLDEITRRGVSDAVLIGAPFLFDPLEFPITFPDSTMSRGAEGLMMTAEFVSGVGPMDSQVEGTTSRREHRLGWCRWWIAHARKFGAEPPSSEYAPFEEVLELCRAARRAHPNARFKREVSATAASTAQSPQTDERSAATPPPPDTPPPPTAPASAASPPTVQHAGRETNRWHRWWPAALIPLGIVIFIFTRRRSGS